MKKWVFLTLITSVLFLVGFLFKIDLNLHKSYNILVLFFTIQTFVLFRIDQWVPKEWAVQVSLAKVVIRLLSSMVFIAVLMFTQDDLFNLVVQFICIYFIYMLFEIGSALTNLRRN